MRTTNLPRHTHSRALSTIVTLALVVGQVVQPVYAATTLLADQPIAAKVAAKPNIFYTLDDSGSMQYNYIPDYVVNAAGTTALSNITKIGTTATATTASTALLTTGDWVTIAGANQIDFNGVFQITVTGGTTFTFQVPVTAPAATSGARTYATGGRFCRGNTNTAACAQILQNSNAWNYPPFFTGDFNRMMYNPVVTYTPPLKWDGLPFTNGVPFSAANIDANGNQGNGAANFALVQRDPYNQMVLSTQRDNLSTKVTVPLYCNTDWPTTAGANLALNPDVGDVNGQYQAGSGGWCRINGTRYDASVPSGAPATAVAGVEYGYNYPWQASTGAIGAQYFFRVVANKTLWCDQSSPFYPRNTASINNCNGGTNIVSGAVQQQCNAQGKVCNPTAALRNYTPAACGIAASYPLYCVAGTGGSGGSTPGTGSIPECTACTCNNDTNPVPANKCSVTGASCTMPGTGLGGDLASCPNQPGSTITGCTGGNKVYNKASAACTGSPAGVLFDPVTNAPTAVTLLTDANTNGMVCRHNVQSYAVFGLPQPGLMPGALATYPRNNVNDVYPANKSGIPVNGYPYSQTGAFTTSVTSGCATVGTTVTIPRHYYTVDVIVGTSDTVQFCSMADNTPDGQWRGFGIGVVATDCQAKNDVLSHKYVRYGAFKRWDMIAATAFPSGKPFLAGASGALTNNASNSESINYANWYANYATRLNAAKTTSANSFANLTTANAGGDYRVGFHNLGDQKAPYGTGSPITNPIKWVDMADWTLAQRTAWYTALFAIKVTNYKTPTIDAMIRIGTFVEFGPAQTGLDANINPIPSTAVDPFPIDIKTSKPISCTNNYHILFTDGTTNQVYLPTGTGDKDGATMPPMPPTGIAEAPPPALPALVVPTLKTWSSWQPPYVQGTPAVANTLADVAAHYWARDLRHDPLPGANLYTDNVPSFAGGGTCTPNGITVNCDEDWTQDVAWWQHVNFSAISFGTEGLLDASTANRDATMAGLRSGALKWPDLTQPNNPIKPVGAAGAVAVDDLWHATVMARGSFVNAQNPTDIARGLSSILAGIANQTKSRSSAAFSGSVLNATNDVIFEPIIDPGWAGNLKKVQIDPATGTPVAVPPLGIWWDFSSSLATQILPTFVGDEPWMLEAKRRVVTLGNNPGAFGKTPGPGVPFQYASLFAAPQGTNILKSLAPTANPTQQQKLIAYLRGGSTFAAGTITIEGTGIGQFRKRFGKVGDISNAQPLIIGPPGNGYLPATDPAYNLFVAAQGARPSFLVAPANDGMVHVIDAGPMPPAHGVGGGSELFAYIPRALFRGTAGNIATEDTTALQALAYQDGGVPIFHHHMYVDSSPRVADIDFNNGIGSTAASWHTIVVGGLGKGGNSYYALDVTDPYVTTEAAAAAKVMWEWTDPDIKVTFGRPVIVKVRETGFPTGRWVVLVTASYNNVSGQGKIYVLDAKTGSLLSTLNTGVGSGPNPSGLAQIHAFVKDQTNQIAEQIYGGDLVGNLWRVDVSLTDSYKSAVPVAFATLIDPLGVPQPVTTAPQIEIDLNNGIDRYVFIGTGRLLDEDDFTNPFPEQGQTMYAIRDGTLAAIKTTGLPILARAGQGGIMDPLPAGGIAAIVGGAPNGWYHDLPNTPADSQRIVTDVQANANIAFYIGTQIPSDPCLIQLPAFIYAHNYTTGKSLLKDPITGFITDKVSVPRGGVGALLVGRIQADGSQSIGVMVSGEVPGTTPYDIENPVTGPGARMSWRLLSGQ
ncbi:MAG: PilC/PilY family type IV pilus protein [Betaproteobacteria bacterium]